MEYYEEKFNEAKKILEEWIDKQGHERCWYYPDLLEELIKIYGVTSSKSPSLPPLEEFKKGCLKYQEEEYKV